MTRRRVFIVDLENVGSKCLMTQTVINKKDVVYILTGVDRNIGTENEAFFESNKWNVIRVSTKNEPNSLDFQLSALIGAILASNNDLEVYVISKDKGFDSIIRFFTKCATGQFIKGDSSIKRVKDFKNMKNTCVNNRVALTADRGSSKKGGAKK